MAIFFHTASLVNKHGKNFMDCLIRTKFAPLVVDAGSSSKRWDLWGLS